MDILNKAKDATEKLAEDITTSRLSTTNDEAIAHSIIKATEKIDRVNAVLEKSGSDYRISGIDLSTGIPPVISYSVELMDKDK